jgi:hypothetical protein
MTSVPELLASLSGEVSSAAPFLVTSSAEGTLVRFRAMLQDTSFAPEIFLPATAGEPDDIEVNDGATEIDYAKLRERGVCWAVGVPGETSWVTEVSRQPASASSLQPADALALDLNTAGSGRCGQRAEGELALVDERAP